MPQWRLYAVEMVQDAVKTKENFVRTPVKMPKKSQHLFYAAFILLSVDK